MRLWLGWSISFKSLLIVLVVIILIILLMYRVIVRQRKTIKKLEMRLGERGQYTSGSIMDQLKDDEKLDSLNKELKKYKKD